MPPHKAVEKSSEDVKKHALRRYRSIAVEESDDAVTYQDVDELAGGDVLEEKEEVVEEVVEPVIDPRHREFLHLQAGLNGVFYQGESHTRTLLDKLDEMSVQWKAYEQECDARFLKLEAFIINISDSVNELTEKIKLPKRK